jgi:anti-sigma-K factor RskA
MSTDLHTLSGAYVLHALSEEERAMFAQHLEECQACRDEVRELAETVGRMGATEATRPPAALRARVLAAADRQPQLPPVVVPLERARTRRRLVRLVVAAAAVVVVVAGSVFGISRLQGRNEPPVASPSVSQVFHAPDVRKATVPTVNGGRLRVALSPKWGRMAVATSGLEPLPRQKVYQLWTLHDGRATSVGVVKDVRTGKVMPIPASGTTVAMTVEPTGGSAQPTTKPIVQVDPARV